MGKKKRNRQAPAPLPQPPLAAPPTAPAPRTWPDRGQVQGPEPKPEVICKVKTMEFGGAPRTIVYPSLVRHQSALLALVNALNLRSDVMASIDDSDNKVSLQHFLLRMKWFYRLKLRNIGNKASEVEVMNTIKLLSRPIDISVNFTRIDGIVSKSVALDIFKHFEVPLYHLWIVDPKDAAVALAVGADEHEIFRALYPFEPPVPIPNADQAVVDFLQGIGLTAFGLQELSNAMENDQISVVFWNKTFHTIVKHDDGLYALHNDLRSFEGDVLWKELSVGGDGRLCTSNFVPVAAPVRPTAQAQEEAERELSWEKPTVDKERKFAAASDLLRQAQKHKCTRYNCELHFYSVINLSRHKQVHRKERTANMDSVNRDDISKFWDELSDEDCKELLSIKDAPAIKGINGDIIYQFLEKMTPEDDLYDIADKLKFIIDCSEKVSSEVLFAALDEASEKMAFSIDINKYPDYSIFDKGVLLLRKVHDVLACCGYFLEWLLMKKWLEYKEDEALRHTAALLDEVADSRLCGKSNRSQSKDSVGVESKEATVESEDIFKSGTQSKEDNVESGTQSKEGFGSGLSLKKPEPFQTLFF